MHFIYAFMYTIYTMTINWQQVNFDWNYAKAFLVTLEKGSLSAAAKSLKLTQPTLSRQVAALESQLNMVLFERTGKKLEPTPNALQLLTHLKTMGEAANQLSLLATGQQSKIEGKIIISCTDVIAAFELPKVIQALQKAHPSIQIEVLVSDEATDLKRRQADIAIRSFRPTESDLIAKKLCVMKATLYANLSYLSQLKHPTKPQQLNNANFIGFYPDNKRYIDKLNTLGFAVNENSFSVLCNDHISHWEMTKQGLGIGVMPINIGDKEPKVARVLSNKIIHQGEIWLVTHRELRTNQRVKTVFEFLAKQLAKAY